MHILTLSYFLAGVVLYPPEFWGKKFLKFFTTKLQRPYLKVATTNKSFSIYITLIINLFLSKSIKKHDTNNIRQLCIGKDQLILVKYWLSFTKVEN